MTTIVKETLENKEEDCVLYRISHCRQLTGNDLRIACATYTNPYTQLELVKNMHWKKSNVNKVVTKLYNLGILKKVLKNDLMAYMVNKNWIEEEDLICESEKIEDIKLDND